MPTKGKMMKKLMVVALVLVGFQTVSAQGYKASGARVKTAAEARPAVDTSERAKVLRAAADALGMPRWSQVGGGKLPEVDVINTVEFWASGTPYSDYHVSLGYNPPGMRVEMANKNAQHSIEVVSGKYAWNESEVGGGLVPGKGTATAVPAAAKERLLQLWTLPFGVVKAGLAAGDKTTVLRKRNGATVFTYPLMGELAGVTVKSDVGRDELRYQGRDAGTRQSDHRNGIFRIFRSWRNTNRC